MINNRYSYKRKKNKAKTKKTKGRGLRGLFRSIFGSASVAPSNDDFNSDGVHDGPGVIARRAINNAEITRRNEIRKDITKNRKEIKRILKEGTPKFAHYLTSNYVEFWPYLANTDPLSEVGDRAYEQKLLKEHENTANALKEIQDHYTIYISQNPKSGGKKSRKHRN